MKRLTAKNQIQPHIANPVCLINLVVLLEVVQCSQFAHPNGILLRQERGKQIRLASFHIDCAVEIRFSYAERPMEIGFLAEDWLVIRCLTGKFDGNIGREVS